MKRTRKRPKKQGVRQQISPPSPSEPRAERSAPTGPSWNWHAARNPARAVSESPADEMLSSVSSPASFDEAGWSDGRSD
jgi:hypothetical protein